MKTCTKCGEPKELSEFSKKASAKDGLRHACKDCSNAAQKLYCDNNPEKISLRSLEYRTSHADYVKEYSIFYREKNKDKAEKYRSKYYADNKDKLDAANKEWARKNPQKALAIRRKYREANKDQRAEYNARYARNNLQKICAKAARRRSSQLKATPIWFDKTRVEAVYLDALRLSKETGQQYHVDHIVPLKSTVVCGLHVDQNLQVLLGSENCRKSNRYWPDMPEMCMEQSLC